MIKRKQTSEDSKRECETVIIRNDGVLVTHTGAPFRGLCNGVEYDVVSYAGEGFMVRVDTLSDLKIALRKHKLNMWKFDLRCKFSADEVISKAMRPAASRMATPPDLVPKYGYAVDLGALH